MTLIVALRSPDGAVIAADSQETVEGRRKANLIHYSVQKIAAETMGNFTLVIGGAGDGELIDAFQERFRTAMPSSAATTIKEFKSLFLN
jgi:hypothetical protein